MVLFKKKRLWNVPLHMHPANAIGAVWRQRCKSVAQVSSGWSHQKEQLKVHRVSLSFKQDLAISGDVTVE